MPNALAVVQSFPNHKTHHQDGGDDEVVATGLVGRVEYVDRGDAESADFAIGDFTTDGDFHDLDLSSIIDAGAKLVVLRVYINDDQIESSLVLRKNGNSDDKNTNRITMLVANVGMHSTFLVAPDSSGLIEYQATNRTWTTMSFFVLGWFV